MVGKNPPIVLAELLLELELDELLLELNDTEELELELFELLLLEELTELLELELELLLEELDELDFEELELLDEENTYVPPPKLDNLVSVSSINIPIYGQGP